MEHYIEVNHISKEFKGNQVLSDITLCADRGQITGIVGHNGSGKSVLFKILTGLMSSDEGEVIADKRKIKYGVYPESLGLIIETPGYIEDLSGFENLKTIASIKNKIDKQIIENYMKMFGLDKKNEKPAKKYSLGMKQKLGLIQAFMEDPDLLILDEPMNALDKDSTKKVRDLLLEKKAQNKCIIIASHLSDDINILCDKVYELDGGIATQIK